MIYPWLEEHWRRLVERLQQGRLPHGLLLVGPAGLGKGELARALAQTMLCESPAANGIACGNCHGCRLFLAGTHPDYQSVAPEETGAQIKIDRIRDLIQFMALSCQYERYKVAVIDPADAMNVNAANSLLKTLEEPADQSVLVLVTAQPTILPATIRSRCQRIDIRAPRLDVAGEWLQNAGIEADRASTLLREANHAPLLALRLEEESVLEQQQQFFAQLMDVLRGRESLPAMAEKWKNGDIDGYLAWQIGWVDDMLRHLQADEIQADQEKAQVLTRLAPIMGVHGLFDLRDQLIQYRRMASGNLNAQLLLEDIFQSWGQTLDQGKRKTA